MKALDYDLPENKIAKHPLKDRSSSKLLIYKNSNIEESNFKNIADFLPEKSHLFINNTKVIQARIALQKQTGAKVELLLLEPYNQFGNPYETLHYSDAVYWKAMIGGAQKFKEGTSISKQLEIDGRSFPVFFERIKNIEDVFLIKIHWENPNPEYYTFIDILPFIGETPIPPYLNRKEENIDKTRYQTVFAKKEGSIAAPTSSLHYDEQVFNKLAEKGVQKHVLTLHVGAGTFLPIKTEEIEKHRMHAEWMELDLNSLNLLLNILKKEEKIIASGTTMIRYLESIYWYGIYILKEKQDIDSIQQSFIEHNNLKNISAIESIEAIISYWKEKDINNKMLQTSIFIYPGYKFKIVNILITNFHQPKSTLLLLVSAFIGENWEKVYNYALNNDYRFLSYGDSSLLFNASNTDK